jgi:hypothetical protein
MGQKGCRISFESDRRRTTTRRTGTAAEVSSCKLDGSADGIQQKFETAKYQACGLYANGQKAYADGFVVGCTKVSNTQQICQALVDSNKLNMNTQPTHSATQLTKPTQAIQPTAEVKKCIDAGKQDAIDGKQLDQTLMSNVRTTQKLGA